MSGFFEGSYLGDATKLADDTRLECGICWTVYDPAQGDDYWQIPAGTPFSQLPEHWRCPNCDAEKDKFMVLDSGTGIVAEPVAPPAGEDPAIPAGLAAELRIAALKAAYAAVDHRMRGLPVHNPKLEVDVIGFRPWGAGALVGVVATPWMMNLVILPDPAAPVPAPLSTRAHVFPSGSYAFTAGGLEGVGAIESCSLFSPMDEFDDPAVVHIVAEAAIEGLFQAETLPEAPAEPEPSPLFDTIRASEREAEARRRATPPPQASRRAFLTGGGGRDPAAPAGG